MTWMYLGPISRLTDPLYPICFAEYIMSSDNEEEVYIGHFSSVDQKGEFVDEYMSIKSLIARLQVNLINGSISQEEYENTLRAVWLPMIARFSARWGLDYVIGDVRRACNDVEAGLQVPQTIWPEVPLIQRVGNDLIIPLNQA